MSDLGYWYGSALQGSSDNYIPPQAIPLSKKNDKWRERCLDAFESIGLRQFRNNLKYTDIFRMINGKMSFSEMSEAMPQYREVEKVLNDVEIPTFLRHYDIIGIIINALAGELMSNSDKFSINTNDDVSSNEYLRTKTDKLWDSIQTDLEKEIETRLLNLGINPNVPQEAFQDPEQYNQYLQQIQSKKAEMTPAAIQSYMDSDWRTVAAKWASLKLEQDRLNHDMDNLDYENFIEYLATGRCFRHMLVSYDFYKPEKWGMMNTFISEDLETKRAEKGDYAGRVHQFSRSQVLTRYGHKLTAKQKEQMAGQDYGYYLDNNNYFDNQNNVSYKKMFESHFHNLQVVPFENYPEYKFNLDIQDALGVPLGEQKIMNRHGEYETVPVMLPKLADVTGDLGYMGHQNFKYLRNDISIRGDLMTVTEVYWKSFKKIGYLSYYNENGDLTSTIVTEDILPEFLSENEIKKLKNISLMELEKYQEPNTIVWDYIPEVWQGTKITGILNGPSQNGAPETYYLDIKPCEFQIKENGDSFDVLLPVAGIVDVGLAPKIEPYQVTYNLVMNQIFNLLEKEIGLFFIFDINFLPSEFREWGDTEDALLYMRDIAKDIGIVPVDSSKQNLVGGANFNQFAAQNLSFSSQISDRVNLAEFIKNKAFEQVGMTPQRLGAPTTYETAEGVRQSTDASYSQTEQYFSKFSLFKKHALELQLSVAQYCQKEGIDLQVFYTQNDATQAFIKESDPDFHLRELGITPISNSKKRKELEVFKQYLLNTNTLGTDELSLAELISSDAMSEVIEAARGARVARQQQESAASQQRIQEIQTQQEETRKTDDQRWQRDEYSKDKDRQTEIMVASINAAGRASDKQSDQDGFDYITNLTNLSLQENKIQADITNKQVENDIKREKQASDKELALKEIQVKLAELANRRAISKDNVQIARMNKN